MIDRRWVLVTDGGTGQARSTLAAVRALGRAGYRPAVTESGARSLAGVSRFCARRVHVPSVSGAWYAPAVQAELDSRPYLTVLASSDAALAALGAPVDHLVDKAEIADRARAAGLAIPPTRVFATPEDLLDQSASLDYPAVVKPARSLPKGSLRSAVLVASPAELGRAAGAGGPVLVQPFLTGGIRAAAGVVWHGRLAAAVHQRYLRAWPPDCGTSSAAETTEPDVDLEERLLRLLEGYDGIFQAQLAGDRLLDLNPRVYGSLPLAVAAGANLPAVWCDLLRGVERAPVRARPGVFYRWIEGDLRHVARRVREGSMSAGQAVRALRPRPGAAHSTETLSDPLPALARLWYAARRHG